jgi:hypothetical protein
VATIREYFDTDARALILHGNWTFGTAAGVALAEVIAKIAYDFEANAKYWYFYVPAMADLSQCLGALFDSTDLENCRLGPDGDGATWKWGTPSIPNGHPQRHCSLQGESTSISTST